MKIALLHYSFHPVTGGVETIVRAHADWFASAGMNVRVICGAGTRPAGADYEFALVPALGANSDAEDAAALMHSLFDVLNDREVIICHNMLTMPFNNRAAEALIQLAKDRLCGRRFIHWTHDIASVNPDYSGDARVHGAGSVIAQCHPQIEYVCISGERLLQLASLPDFQRGRTSVVPNGIDLWQIAGATDRLKALLQSRRILEKEIVLFHPARLLPRKRVEISIGIAAALKSQGLETLLLLSGAPDPHRPELDEYAHQLRGLVSDAGLLENVLFAPEHFALDDAEMAACYRMCDAVVFPGTQEGFGLPVLEAAAHGKVLIASDIAPTRAHACGDVLWIGADGSAERTASGLVNFLRGSSLWKSKQKLIARFSWERVFTEHLLPLLRRR